MFVLVLVEFVLGSLTNYWPYDSQSVYLLYFAQFLIEQRVKTN